MSKSLDFIYYVLVILTIFNVMTLFIWFSITNLIRISSTSSISLSSDTSVQLTEFAGSGNGSQGKIEFTTGTQGLINGHVVVTVSLPSSSGSFEVSVICMTVRDTVTNQTLPGIALNFPVIKQTANSFTFENGNPLNALSVYTLSYVVVQT